MGLQRRSGTLMAMALVVVVAVVAGAAPGWAQAAPSTSTTSTTVAPTTTTTTTAKPTTTSSTSFPLSTTSTTRATTTTTSAPPSTTTTSTQPVTRLIVVPSEPSTTTTVPPPSAIATTPVAPPPLGPLPLPAASLSPPDSQALVASLEAFVGRAARLRAAVAEAQSALGPLEAELARRQAEQDVAAAGVRQSEADLARAQAEWREIQAQRREAARDLSAAPRPLPAVDIGRARPETAPTHQQLLRAERELGQRIAALVDDVRRATRHAEEASGAVGAKAGEVAAQRQALARLQEELRRAPSEADVAAALSSVRDRLKPSRLALADIPADYYDLYRRAALTCPGLPWTVLAAIGSAETSHGRSTLPGVKDGANSAGAMGPMQFLAETWAAYGADGSGDGVVDVYNATDAVFGAARYLCASGGGESARLADAIWAYNHAGWYVAAVLTRAVAYGTAGLGTAAADATALVDDPNLTLTADARADLLSGEVDPRLVAALAAAAVDHRIEVSVVRTGHSQFVRGTDRVSNHYYGRGVDISSVDGAAVSASNPAALRLAVAFLTADPSIRPDELGSPWPDLAAFPGTFSDADHADHLHLGYR